MAHQNAKYTGAPIHPISALLVVVLDWLWLPVEGGATLSVIGLLGIPLLIATIAIISLTGVFLVQKFVANDQLGAAFAKAFFMAVFAAIPFPVIGTLAGTAMLGMAGLNAVGQGILRLPKSTNK